MLKTLIVLPDSTELLSGVGEANAIQSATITECVNGAQELTLGSCCANMIEAKILTPNGALSVAAGDELTVYRVADDGTRYKIGLFTTEKPARPTANSMSITAYDRVSWLDKDLTQWLAALDAWPYSLYDFASMVCTQCGLTLANDDIPNGGYSVQRFSGDGITGRQIMQWIGQIAGRFCRATPDGHIEFAWYTPVDPVNIGISTVEEKGTVMYYQNSLSFEDYTVAEICKVQLRKTEDDVGVVYPDGLEGSVNTYIITGNPLLIADEDDLVAVAQNLYEILRTVSYTPCKVSVPASFALRAGDVVRITDRNNKTITAYVMTKTQKGQKDTLECTGSPRRDSTTVVNNRGYADLQGKVMNLRIDLDGLYVEHSNTVKEMGGVEQRLMAEISLNTEGIKAEVSNLTSTTDDQRDQLQDMEKKVSAAMTSEQVNLAIQKEIGKGAAKVSTTTGYTFDDTGLTVEKSNSEMKTQITEDGMTVYKNGQEMLRANNQGVEAVDLKAKTYLIVGKNSRFEDMPGGNRTGCFWIGE